MLHVNITELSETALQREASKIANNCIKKALHYIPEADITVYNLELDAYNVTSLSDTDGDGVYIVFTDDNKIIRTMQFYTYEFMELIIK